MTKTEQGSIAEALRAVRPNDGGPLEAQWYADVAAVASVFASASPRFNRAEFDRAVIGMWALGRPA